MELQELADRSYKHVENMQQSTLIMVRYLPLGRINVVNGDDSRNLSQKCRNKTNKQTINKYVCHVMHPGFSRPSCILYLSVDVGGMGHKEVLSVQK